MKWKVELFRTMRSDVGYVEIEASNKNAAYRLAYQLVENVRRNQQQVEWERDDSVLAIGLADIEPMEEEERKHG